VFTNRGRNILKLAALPIALAAVALLLGAGIGSPNHAQAHLDNSVEFHIDVTGGGAGCNTLADQKGNCVITTGSVFTVNAYLDSFGTDSYGLYAVSLDYTGVVSKDAGHNTWPDCNNGDSGSTGPVSVYHICAVQRDDPPSTFTGKMVTFNFTCTADGTISMEHADDFATRLVRVNPSLVRHEAGPDVLNIECRANTPTPPSPVGGLSIDPNLAGGSSGGSSAGFLLGGSALAALLLGATAWRMRKAVNVG